MQAAPVERVAWMTAVVCLTAWSALALSGAVGARAELRRFADERQSDQLSVAAPDLTLWSEPRVRAWRESLAHASDAPLAVLRVPRVHIEAPVLEGTDDWTLNRGVGHIAETAAPGAEGNAGIAGHRDGFFRALKDVRVGDTIEIATLRGTDAYRIERIWIVAPDDVSVLEPTPSRAVTLVTCYPFYFIGAAPQRYIVRAVRVPAGHS
jgi:sortase A